MNSEKVKEIKECLLWNGDRRLSYTNTDFKKVYVFYDDILTLINELESENTMLRNAKVVYETVDYCAEDLRKAQDRIAELEKENKDYYDRLNNLQTYIDNHEEIWKGNTNNAVKQFAEKLEEKCISGGIFPAFVANKLDETLKEFIK